MKAKFSGHETFPIRYGWLYKLLFFIDTSPKIESFSSNDVVERAIVELGVGKNMVSSMRYWAEVCGLVEFHEHYRVTHIGKAIFLTPDSDPYMEIKGTSWLIHFLVNFNESDLTAYRFFFNHFNGQSFEKSFLINEIINSYNSLISSKSKLVTSSLSKDVDVFISMYNKKHSDEKKRVNQEALFISPLSELGLLKESTKGFYNSELKYQADLPLGIFAYGLLRYCETFSVEFKENPSLSEVRLNFESLLVQPFSPGRIFRLNEFGLSRFLDDASLHYDGISWTDNLGLRQIVVDANLVRNVHSHLLDYLGNK